MKNNQKILIAVSLYLTMFTLNMPAQVNVSDKSTIVSGGFNMTTEATVTITGGKLNVNNLNMESGASLLGNSNLIVNGSAGIKRYITGNWTGQTDASTIFHYVSSPTSAGTGATFTDGLLRWYDEPTERLLQNQSTGI